MKKHVGHRKYDELLVSLLHKIASYQLREELLEYFCNELFEISSCDMIMVLESYDANIQSIDDIEISKLLSKKKNIDILKNIENKNFRKKSENIFSKEDLTFKVLLESLTSENSVVYHTSSDNIQFCSYFMPMSSYNKKGWLNFIYLPRPIPKHKEKFLVLWYEGYSIDKIADSISQDERVLYLFKNYYKLASFNIKNKAKFIYEQRMELLKALIPSIISHEVYHRSVIIGSSSANLLKRNKKILNASTIEEAKKESTKLEETLKDSLISTTETLKDISGSISKLTKQATSEEVNIKEMLEDSIRLISTISSRKLIKINLKCIKNIIKSDRALLMHIVMNIMLNSVEAYNELKMNNKIIDIKVDNGNKDIITIYISDNAKEIPTDIQNKLFDEGFSTKPEGNGLGLSICSYIVGFLGGYIELIKYKSYLTSFKIDIPRDSFKITTLNEEVNYEK